MPTTETLVLLRPSASSAQLRFTVTSQNPIAIFDPITGANPVTLVNPPGGAVPINIPGSDPSVLGVSATTGFPFSVVLVQNGEPDIDETNNIGRSFSMMPPNGKANLKFVLCSEADCTVTIECIDPPVRIPVNLVAWQPQIQGIQNTFTVNPITFSGSPSFAVAQIMKGQAEPHPLHPTPLIAAMKLGVANGYSGPQPEA